MGHPSERRLVLPDQAWRVLDEGLQRLEPGGLKLSMGNSSAPVRPLPGGLWATDPTRYSRLPSAFRHISCSVGCRFAEPDGTAGSLDRRPEAYSRARQNLSV